MTYSPRRPIPEQIRRFILTSIPSIPFLEALLLLRSDPSSSWDVPVVARRLYMSEATASELLSALASAGIARATLTSEETTHYMYAPEQPGLAEVLDEVARIYAVDLVGVTTLIHARVDKRAVQFADAFRWKKDN